jgi:hypothetical protein
VVVLNTPRSNFTSVGGELSIVGIESAIAALATSAKLDNDSDILFSFVY